MGLDLIEFVIAIEEHFNIEIPNADAQRLTTPRATIDYLTLRLTGRDMWTREHIAQDVRALVTSELGVRNFTDDARFVEDLRVD